LREAGLDVRANECVLSINQNVDGSGQEESKTQKAEKVDKEEDELDKICTAAHDRTVGDSR